ncbi:hypothetical protein Prudu_005507, partial [Prunus dulcis]
TSAENSAESPLAEAKSGPVVDPVHFYDLGAKNKSRAPHNPPESQTAKSGDYDQPVPPADSSMTPSQLESLWQDAGDRSRDTKSAEPQILALTV